MKNTGNINAFTAEQCSIKINLYAKKDRINERKEMPTNMRNMYQNNKFLRRQKCNNARNIYHTNNNIRQQKITNMSYRYQNHKRST